MDRFISNHTYIIHVCEKKIANWLSSCIYTLIHTSKFQLGSCKNKQIITCASYTNIVIVFKKKIH